MRDVLILFAYFLGDPDETDDATTQAQDDQEYEYGNHLYSAKYNYVCIFAYLLVF